MESFIKTIDGSQFNIQGFNERGEEVCRVTVDTQSFKMVVGESGEWIIPHQVPLWIKRLEKELGTAIDAAYCE